MTLSLPDRVIKLHSSDSQAFIHNQLRQATGTQKFISILQYTTNTHRFLNRHVYFSIFSFIFFLFVSLPQADAKFNSLPEYEPGPNAPHIPPAYGKVIYSYNENSPKKLYIVGINHRDSQSRLNDIKTAKTQAEIYRIGEWLNRNNKIDILLPEGFFSTASAVADFHPALQSASLDNRT